MITQSHTHTLGFWPIFLFTIDWVAQHRSSGPTKMRPHCFVHITETLRLICSILTYFCSVLLQMRLSTLFVSTMQKQCAIYTKYIIYICVYFSVSFCFITPRWRYSVASYLPSMICSNMDSTNSNVISNVRWNRTAEMHNTYLVTCMYMDVRILRQKIANSACVICKFCAPFLQILHNISTRFFYGKIVCDTGVLSRVSWLVGHLSYESLFNLHFCTNAT